MAAFSHVLSVFSRERKVAYHTINHGRTDKRLRNAYGMFVKSVPVCVDVDPQEKVTDFIKGFRRELMSTIRYGSYPFTHFCNDLKLMPTVSFGFQGADVLESIELDGTSFHLVQLTKGKTDEDLACVIYSSEEEYEIRVNASDALYTQEKLRTFASAVKSCAENMMKNPESVMQDISVVSSKEIQHILSISSGPTLDYDIHETFVDMCLHQVAQRPEAIAVVDENGSISYRELDRRSDMIASRLVSFGIARNEFVSIMTGCHSTFLAAAIGIEKAGAAYVPLDYKYPIDRLQYMLEDSENKVLITEHGISEEKDLSGVSHSTSHTLFMDDLLSREQREHISPVNLSTPDGLAYMIYTSGSTGKPKGVMIPHRAKASFVRFIAKEWHLNASSRISCHSSYSFDASVEDLYPALTVGGTVYLVPEEVRMDIDLLYKYICDNGITGGSYSTQIGQILIQNYDLPVEYLVMGGEKMTVNPDCGIRLINAYGPTEFTVDATYYEIEHGRQYKNIPIGKPLYNQSAFIVDKYGNLLPQGVAGELCLMGTQMACGYWKREDLTEKAFTFCPFIPGKTMYHTGDLAQWNEEGELEYLGRIDNQVKLRGFRIEMGEIESRAVSFREDIKSVAAEVKEIHGTQHLCLYYVSEVEINEEDLKTHLAATLTEYMVPDVFMRLDVMPMTPNGKIDRKGLPVPVLARKEYVEPATELEHYFCDTFARILKLEKVGATDHFFQIGGSSLIAMRAVAAFVKDGYRIVYAELFNHPTPRSLAALIDDQKANKDDMKSDWAVELESYDYSKIDQVLKDNNLGIYQKCKEEKQSLSTVLLTGATGYLGIHVLHELLHDESVSRIYCIIRDNKQLSGSSRLRTLLFYYFDKTYEEQFGKRLIIINGDLTDAKSFDEVERQMKGITSSITVINCAANVKHFSAGTDIEDVNIGGVKNCISFCLHSGARLIHTSTGSICGGFISETHVIQRQLKENELYFGQVLGSKYTYSKFIAERMVLEAIATRGLNGKIMRLGNLSARSTDGEFQINFHTNSFVGRLKAYQMLQCMPYSLVDMQVEFSPINEVARAIILLSSTPRECTVFQPMNIHSQLFGDVLGCMRHIGYNIRKVEDDEFKKVVTVALENTQKASILQSLLAYNVNKSKGKNVVFNVTDSEYTAQVLYRLGFSWSITTWDYIENFEKILQKMGLFDDDYTR